MQLSKRLNAKNIILLMLAIWLASGLANMLEKGNIHVRAITFSRADEPALFWFSVSLGIFGILSLLFIVFFADTGQLRKPRASEQNEK